MRFGGPELESHLLVSAGTRFHREAFHQLLLRVACIQYEPEPDPSDFWGADGEPLIADAWSDDGDAGDLDAADAAAELHPQPDADAASAGSDVEPDADDDDY